MRQELNVEDQRHIAEQLSEEELAIFDLLTQPDMTLSEEDKAEVKKVVQELLETLKREKLVLDWRKKQQAQAAVKKTVRDMFYYALPPVIRRKSVNGPTLPCTSISTIRIMGRVEVYMQLRARKV